MGEICGGEEMSYCSKLLQRPHKITTPLLQRIRHIILPNNFLSHLETLIVQRLMDRGIHVIFGQWDGGVGCVLFEALDFHVIC